MKEKTFRLLALLTAVLVLALGIVGLGEVLKPVWHDTPLMEAATDIMLGFYAEPQDSLDVLFLGSSHIFCGVNPLVIYEQTGLKSYDLCSGVQRNWVAYHYLEEALKTQSPSVVVLDTAMLFEETQNDEARNRMAVDYMRPSANKWAMARTSLNQDSGETMLSYYLPFFRYHDRIWELTAEDITFFFEDHRNPLHGYRFEYTQQSQSHLTIEPYGEATPSDGPLWPEGSKAYDYLQRIMDLCGEKGIRLVLINTPVTYAWAQRSANLTAFAQKNGIVFMDFAPLAEDIGLVGSRDFYDANHLNNNGAYLFSVYLSHWLKDSFFADAALTSDPVWDADLAWFNSRFTPVY